MYLVYILRRVLYLTIDIVLLVGGCCSRDDVASLYLEGRMLDLRTDTELWSTLNQWGAPPHGAGGETESAPVNRERCNCGTLTVDM